jgi:molecular chaperone GrpE
MSKEDVIQTDAKEKSVENENEETLSPQEALIAKLEEENESLTKELETQKDEFTRKVADLDNYRKRLIREKEAAVQFANERLIQDIIPILDDFDRAIESGEKTNDVTSYAQGVKLIQSHLLEMLARNWGLKRMDDIVGKEFSPHEHEAMLMEETNEFDSETVLAELQKGYYLHDRVLRTAKVKVGKPV